MSVEDRVKKLETRYDAMVRQLDDLHQRIADHIVDLRRDVGSLEKRFGKLEKRSEKTAKLAEPKARERETLDIVEKALAAYDKRGAKGK